MIMIYISIIKSKITIRIDLSLKEQQNPHFRGATLLESLLKPFFQQMNDKKH